MSAPVVLTATLAQWMLDNSMASSETIHALEAIATGKTVVVLVDAPCACGYPAAICTEKHSTGICDLPAAHWSRSHDR